MINQDYFIINFEYFNFKYFTTKNYYYFKIINCIYFLQGLHLNCLYCNFNFFGILTNCLYLCYYYYFYYSVNFKINHFNFDFHYN